MTACAKRIAGLMINMKQHDRISGKRRKPADAFGKQTLGNNYKFHRSVKISLETEYGTKNGVERAK